MRDLEKKEIRLYRGIFKFNTEIHMLLFTRVLDSSQTSWLSGTLQRYLLIISCQSLYLDRDNSIEILLMIISDKLCIEKTIGIHVSSNKIIPTYGVLYLKYIYFLTMTIEFSSYNLGNIEISMNEVNCSVNNFQNIWSKHLFVPYLFLHLTVVYSFLKQCENKLTGVKREW